MAWLREDVRLAVRRLRQQPGFTLVAVLTLALGLGANTAVFALVRALMLRSLPVERPHELYRLGDTNDCCVNSGLAGRYSLFSFRLFEHLKANAPEFEQLAAFQATTIPLGVRRSGDAVASSLQGAFVSGSYFTMFGVRPAAGRLFTAEDDRPGTPAVAVMSHWAWTQRYAQDPTVIGGVVFVNGTPVTVVGVASQKFFGDTVRPDPAAIWMPIWTEPALRGATSLIDRTDQNWLYAIGRLPRSAEPGPIGARLTTALQQWLSAQPWVSNQERTEVSRQHVVVVPAGGGVGIARIQYARSLNILFAASALVLLIAAANLANLLLARADRGQAAIRAALGASSARLIRQALTEGILLALASALAGLAIAAAGTQALINLMFPLAGFVPMETAPAPAVWLFALLLAVVTGALFTAAPAWAMSRTAPLEALSGTARSAHVRSFVPRRSLVVVQVALSLVLLSTAGLLAASLSRLERQPLGFEPSNRFVVLFEPPGIGGEIDRLSHLYRRLHDSLHGVPGVQRVAFSLYSPMQGNNWSSGISIAGRERAPDATDGSSWNRVSAGYFETIGTRVLRGRSIEERDAPGATRVAVVNESFVRRFFDRADPLGRTVGIGGPSHGSDYEIVGVVEDVKYTGAARPEVRPMIFLPALQTVPYEDASAANVQSRSTLLRAIVVQVSPAARGIEGGIRRALSDVNPDLNVLRVLPMATQVGANFRMERLMARLTSLYGLLALALAALGLYGVTAYAVSQRTREIGVRMALGADRWQIVRESVRGPLAQTAVGLALGTGGAYAAGRAVAAQLYEARGFDATLFAGAAGALILSAAVAAAWPARRAASVNPASALRGE